MNQSTYNSLKSFIWGIANDCLVDVYDVGDYRKIILPFFVIRRFDAVLEPTNAQVIQIWNFVEWFATGRISRTAFWELAKFNHPTHQIAFCSEEALKCIRFEGSDTL